MSLILVTGPNHITWQNVKTGRRWLQSSNITMCEVAKEQWLVKFFHFLNNKLAVLDYKALNGLSHSTWWMTASLSLRLAADDFIQRHYAWGPKNSHECGRFIFHCCWTVTLEQLTSLATWFWTHPTGIPPAAKHAWFSWGSPHLVTVVVLEHITNVLTCLLSSLNTHVMQYMI